MDKLSQLAAASTAEFSEVDRLLGKIYEYILNPIIYFMYMIAVALFLYGIVEFLMHRDDPAAVKTATSHVIWGLLGFVVIFGVKGIILIIAQSIGVSVDLP